MSAHLLFLKLVLVLDPGQDVGHVGLQHHAAHHQLAEDVVDTVSVEDQVQLTHILKALVQGLHKYLQTEYTYRLT